MSTIDPQNISGVELAHLISYFDVDSAKFYPSPNDAANIRLVLSRFDEAVRLAKEIKENLSLGFRSNIRAAEAMEDRLVSLLADGKDEA